MRKTLKRISVGFILMTLLGAQSPGGDSFDAAVNNFVDGYKALELPPLELSYAANLAAIGDLAKINAQEEFFLEQQKIFNKYDQRSLDRSQWVAHELIKYEISLNLLRVSLEKKWLDRDPEIKGTKLAEEEMGKAWYRYFLKKWIDLQVEPERMLQFGHRSIKEIQGKIDRLPAKYEIPPGEFRKHLQNNKVVFKDKEQLQKYFEGVDHTVRTVAGNYFPYLESVPEVKIKVGEDPSLSMVPGYYSNDTFYYNFFGAHYDAGHTQWLYLHEAVPGHHYQYHVRNKLEQTELQRVLRCISFIEGWGAYIEQFGYDLGLYDNLHTEYGYLEWNLIRAVRVVIDVGINYYDWSDEKAFDFWRSHIHDQDEVGTREIARMKRWPAQVITYIYGGAALNELRKPVALDDLKAHHTKILAYGDIPLSVLKKALR